MGWRKDPDGSDMTELELSGIRRRWQRAKPIESGHAVTHDDLGRLLAHVDALRAQLDGVTS
jgi:hypothetical protein